MGFFGFTDPEVADLVFEYFYAVEETFKGAYKHLGLEDSMVGALQVLLMNKEVVRQVQDLFRGKGYDFEVEFTAIREGAEPVTGVDFSILLKVYTHPLQFVDSFEDEGFLARDCIRKSILVQAKNLGTTYGKKVRLDQLRKMLQYTENGGVAFFFSEDGIEVSSANDLVVGEIERHVDIPPVLRYDFPNFMYNFFETNVGDHDPRLYSAIEEGQLASYFEYTIKPSTLRIDD